MAARPTNVVKGKAGIITGPQINSAKLLVKVLSTGNFMKLNYHFKKN